ncbi:MAG: hypothetical protein J7L54_03745 [Elusimicrobia bacterium]|nr:hypothetical protein [Elusimicrobiota bacterium]
MKRFLVCFLAIALISVGGFASGEEEATIVTGDPVLWQQTDVDSIEPTPAEGETVAEVPAVGVRTGLDMVFTDKMKIFIIPVSYTLPFSLAGKLSVGAGIPYVVRTITDWYNVDHTNSGLGDVSVNAKYDWGDEVYFRLISSLIVKIPTGDTDKTYVVDQWGTTLTVPLGRGSWDVAAAVTAIRRIAAFRIIGNIGFRHNGKYENSSAGTTTDYGEVFNLLAGAEYRLNSRISPYGNLRFIKIAESQVESASGNYGNWDDLTAIDFITGLKYKVISAVSANLGIEWPVYRKYNSNITAPAKKLTITLKGNYRF